MTDLKKLAEEILDQWDIHSHEVSDINMQDWYDLEDKIEAALKKVREETIDECASLCEEVPCVDHCACRTAEELMGEIRALKSKPEGEK